MIMPRIVFPISIVTTRNIAQPPTSRSHVEQNISERNEVEITDSIHRTLFCELNRQFLTNHLVNIALSCRHCHLTFSYNTCQWYRSLLRGGALVDSKLAVGVEIRGASTSSVFVRLVNVLQSLRVLSWKRSKR
jgi:hypothetical protein